MQIRISNKLILIIILSFLFAGISKAQENEIEINDDIKLERINESFYVHISWFNDPDFGRFPSNGLLFIKNGEAIMIDTPNNNEQTKQLLDYLKDSMDISVKKLIIGHSHEDCLGGFGYIKSLGIESISGALTKDVCVKKKLPIPDNTFDQKLEFEFHGEKVICEYFGGGHTIDNIVVYFPSDKILFGGCLIKSLNSNGLGYIKESDIENWDKTIVKIMREFPDIDYVIPGHGAFGDTQLLKHTIELVKLYKEKHE